MPQTNGASYYCNSQDHTYTFCRGYNAGWYAAAQPKTTNDNSSIVQQNSTNIGALNQSSPSQQQPEQPQEQNASNQQAPQQNVSTTAWKDFGDFSDLANIPLVGGIIASHSVATHILHNEQGVFIPWSVICAQGSQYLLKSCSSLVNPDGSLTSQGDTAVGCIRNGFVAAAAATKFNVPFDTIKNALKGFEGLTGCGGIVDMDQIQNSTELHYLLHSAASLASK